MADEGPETQDLGVIWKDLSPSDFPELWREVEDAEDMSFATLVELMLEHLSEDQLLRVAMALNDECDRRDTWESWDVRRRLTVGDWQLALPRRKEETNGE